jgi:hypothetical protein
MFDFASTKALLRRTVHRTLGVDAFYTDDAVIDPAPIKARWHNKIDRFGDPEQLGFAEIIQGIDRIILIPEDYPEIEFKHGGRIEFPKYGNAFLLDAREPSSGPLEVIWQATVTA